jgi:hypothetical protein
MLLLEVLSHTLELAVLVAHTAHLVLENFIIFWLRTSLQSQTKWDLNPTANVLGVCPWASYLTSPSRSMIFELERELKSKIDEEIIRAYLAPFNEFKFPGLDKLYPRLLREPVDVVTAPVLVSFEK